MNFASRSVKPDLKPQNEDFLFEAETPRGLFFALLDFPEHDFANLNSTLEAKLETIVSSLVTLANCSPDLFLGFLAREINNFLRHLGQQSDDSELSCSAALCLVSGDRLWYFLCGNTRVVLFNQDRTFELRDDDESAGLRLGQHEEAGAFGESVRQFALEQDDLILIMTGGLASELRNHHLSNEIAAVESLDASEICDLLMEISESSQEDRTLVVAGGPYERSVAPPAELNNSLTDSNERLDNMNEGDLSHVSDIENQRLREIDERLEQLDVVLANKADSSEVLGLHSEVLKLGVLARTKDADSQDESEISLGSTLPPGAVASSWSRTALWGVLVLIFGTLGGYFGGWAHASRTKKPVETWSVKSSGSQILLSRLNDTGLASSVLIPTAAPVKAKGEQTFSTFADAKHYIDSVTPSTPMVPVEEAVVENDAPVPQPKPAPRPVTVERKSQPAGTSVAFRQGDSLQKLAQRYNVATSKLIALNPGITRWSQVKAGQKIVVPAGTQGRPAATAKKEKAEPKKIAGKEATVAAGETLDKLANRLKLTPSRLRQLNPQITNWSRIQAGQKVVVSNSARS